MPVNTTFPVEGDAFEATDLNAQFTSVEGAINALAVEDGQREVLRREHLPTTIDDVFTTASTRGGLQATGKDQPTQDKYSNGLTLTVVSTYTVAAWQVFSTAATSGSGGSAAPYGPGGGTGWRIPADDGDIAYAAERRLASPYWNPDDPDDDHGVTALLCNFGVNVVDSDEITVEFQEGNTVVAAGAGTLWLAIGYETLDEATMSTTSRYIAQWTIRAFPVDAVIRGDASIVGLIRDDDVPEGEVLVAVFGAICSQHLGSYAWRATASATGTPVTIDYYHFNYEPIRGERL